MEISEGARPCTFALGNRSQNFAVGMVILKSSGLYSTKTQKTLTSENAEKGRGERGEIQLLALPIVTG